MGSEELAVSIVINLDGSSGPFKQNIVGVKAIDEPMRIHKLDDLN